MKVKMQFSHAFLVSPFAIKRIKECQPECVIEMLAEHAEVEIIIDVNPWCMRGEEAGSELDLEAEPHELCLLLDPEVAPRRQPRDEVPPRA